MFVSRGYVRIREPIKTMINKLHVLEVQAVYWNPRSNVQETVYCVLVPFDAIKLSSSLGKRDVCTYCEENAGGAQTHYMFITDSISFQAVAYLNSLPSYWEALSYDDTACAKNAHYYVPMYTVLTDIETQAVERRFGDRSKFNKMVARVDAMARFLDFRTGDVVRVKKANGAENYRLLIPEEHIM
jgi:DNA-directed RNA polymerase subunit H (RpoH/RPB5)